MVVGDNKIDSNMYSIKDMEKQEQVSIPFPDLIELVSKYVYEQNKKL